MIRKMKTAVDEPHKIYPYVQKRLNDDVLDPIRHSYLKRSCDDPESYVVELNGYELVVNLNDGGIGRDLALYKVREPFSSAAYRKELNLLKGSKEKEIQIIEAGANIGYYALIPAVDLENVKIYAAEVEPTNVERLIDNIDRNSVGDKFEVDCVAIGDKNGEMEVQLSTHSNRHSLQEQVKSENKFTDSQIVPVKTGEKWLSEKGINPDSIDVLRMDVEGYEAKILRGMPKLDIDLIHIEVHPYLMSNTETNEVIQWLSNTDLDIVIAGRNREQVRLTEFDEITDYRWVEIVASNHDELKPTN